MKRDYPARPIVGVGALTWNGDQVLLVKRRNKPRQGEWSLPGGAQHLGETVQQAIVREVQEEAGIHIQVTDIVDVIDVIDPDENNKIRHHYTLIDVLAEYTGGEVMAGDDASDAAWFTLERALEVVSWEETRRVLKKSFVMKQANAGQNA